MSTITVEQLSAYNRMTALLEQVEKEDIPISSVLLEKTKNIQQAFFHNRLSEKMITQLVALNRELISCIQREDTLSLIQQQLGELAPSVTVLPLNPNSTSPLKTRQEYQEQLGKIALSYLQRGGDLHRLAVRLYPTSVTTQNEFITHMTQAYQNTYRS